MRRYASRVQSTEHAEHLPHLIQCVRAAAPPQTHAHRLGAEVVLAEGDGRDIRQAAVDSTLVVGAVDQTPVTVDDVGLVARIAQRHRHRRERRVLGQGERSRSFHAATLSPNRCHRLREPRDSGNRPPVRSSASSAREKFLNDSISIPEIAKYYRRAGQTKLLFITLARDADETEAQ